MTTLNWRTAREVELTDKLIPDPNGAHHMLGRLQEVRVALEGGFVHIDPRRVGGNGTDPNATEYPVHIVPATSVRSITYQVVTPQPVAAIVPQVF